MSAPRTPAKRVLFVNQTSNVSGAERSLLDLLKGLPEHVVAAVACPRGQLSDLLVQRGIPVAPIAGTDVSFRLHPLHTTAGVGWVVQSALRVRALAREVGATIVHANSTRAGLAAALAARIGGPPAIVHLRDWTPDTRLASITLSGLETAADALVANSAFVAEQLPHRRGSLIRVVHNPIDLARFDPGRIDRAVMRAELDLAPGDVAMAIVAQFTPWKGQDDAVRILAALAQRHPGLRLLLVGSAKFTAASSRYDNAAFERQVRTLAESLGVASRAHFLGERGDVPRILRAADILLVPSWKEAFGRIVVEGMAMGLPVAATSVGGPAEILRNGTDGLLLAPRQPAEWAKAITPWILEERARAKLGAAGRRQATARFGIERHASEILAVYDEVLR